MNGLEDIINKHRERFDSLECIAQERIWMGIDIQLPKKSRSIIPFWLKIAAAVTLLFTATLSYNYLTLRNKMQDTTAMISEYFPEVGKDISTLQDQIHVRMAALSFDGIDPTTYPDYVNQMQVLQQDYQNTLQDLSRMGKEEAVLRVLMRYHQRQLDLLERLSNEIEKKKLYEKRNIPRDIY